MADWENGLCSHVCGGDCGTCMGAWFCSCFLHGRTSQRLDKFPSTEKPDLCDGNCAIWCLSAYCGLSWIPQMLKRGKLRDRFGIQGNACNDCLASFFCAPCALAQAEMEVKGRAEKAQHEKANGYAQPQGGMQYQPQQPNASQPHMQHQYSNGGSPAPMYHAPSKH